MGKAEAVLGYFIILSAVGVLAVRELIKEGVLWGPAKLNDKMQGWLDKLEGLDNEN